MQHCEVCGRPTARVERIVIEGVPLLVCDDCRSLGEAAGTRKKPRIGPVSVRPSAKKALAKPRVSTGRQGIAVAGGPKGFEEDLSVVQGYGVLIKRARESMQLTPDELGRRIGEKASVIRKLEMGRLVPDGTLAKKLEHALKIRLLAPSPEDSKVEGLKVGKGREKGDGEGEAPTLTLGDIVRVKEKSRQNPENSIEA